MRVCLVLPELRPSGGVATVLSHATRLQQSQEFDIDVVALVPGGTAPEGVRLTSLEEARGRHYDVAVATWWETVPAVLALESAARVLLVQSAEERFYRPTEPSQRLGAGLALAAPVHFFVVARWLGTLLNALRPDARTWHVPNGIEKSLFVPPSESRRDGPLRVLIEGQHSLWFKAVEDALDAVGRMREAREVTLVSLDPDGARVPDDVQVVGNLDAAAMRDQYAAHDVLVKLSRVESLGLPLVEACHMGLPCVVTPFTGHSEVIRHGENGLVVGYDDPDAVARALDHLARDRAALATLSEGAASSMRTWPSLEQAAATFATALRELRDAPMPAPGPAAFNRWRIEAEVTRVSLGEREVRERALRGSVGALEDAVAERDAWLRRREQQVADLEDQLRSIRESRTYRVASTVQGVVNRVRR